MKKIIIPIFLTSLLFLSCENPVSDNSTDSDTDWNGSVGDTGPGGGYVYYDDEIGFDFDEDGTIQNDEKNLMPDYRWLEYAETYWDSATQDDPDPIWYSSSLNIPAITDITDDDLFPYSYPDDTNIDVDVLATTMGTGASNTQNAIDYFDTQTSMRTGNEAVSRVDNYTSTTGSRSDWFLPSLGEMYVAVSSAESGRISSYRYYHTSNESQKGYTWSIYTMPSLWGSFHAAKEKVYNNYSVTVYAIAVRAF